MFSPVFNQLNINAKGVVKLVRANPLTIGQIRPPSTPLSVGTLLREREGGWESERVVDSRGLVYIESVITIARDNESSDAFICAKLKKAPPPSLSFFTTGINLNWLDDFYFHFDNYYSLRSSSEEFSSRTNINVDFFINLLEKNWFANYHTNWKLILPTYMFVHFLYEISFKIF